MITRNHQRQRKAFAVASTSLSCLAYNYPNAAWCHYRMLWFYVTANGLIKTVMSFEDH